MRPRSLLLLAAVTALAGCADAGDNKPRDVITAPSEPLPQTPGNVAPLESTTVVDAPATTNSPTTNPPTTTAPTTTVDGTLPAVTTTSEPGTGDVLPENLYAYAAAEAIAERANDEGLDGLDPDELVLALETASEAAYEIEFPTVVETLDVRISRDGTSVTIETGTITDDGNETGKSYVCVSGGRANAQQTPCGGD